MSRLISTRDLHNIVMKRKTEYGKLATLIDNIVEEMVQETLTVNAIEIPNGATNGDMIKAIFPSSEVREIMDDLVHYTLDGYVGAYIPKDWWNAPYRIDEESEDEK